MVCVVWLQTNGRGRDRQPCSLESPFYLFRLILTPSPSLQTKKRVNLGIAQMPKTLWQNSFAEDDEII